MRLGSVSLLFFVFVALLARMVYGDLAGRFSAASEKLLRTVPNTDVNPYGANFFLDREVEAWKLDKTLQMASEAGIGWVKQQFPWEAIEPRRKGEFLEPSKKTDSWAKYDEIVALCGKYNLRVIARLDRPPERLIVQRGRPWARRRGRGRRCARAGRGAGRRGRRSHRDDL